MNFKSDKLNINKWTKNKQNKQKGINHAINTENIGHHWELHNWFVDVLTYEGHAPQNMDFFTLLYDKMDHRIDMWLYILHFNLSDNSWFLISRSPTHPSDSIFVCFIIHWYKAAGNELSVKILPSVVFPFLDISEPPLFSSKLNEGYCAHVRRANRTSLSSLISESCPFQKHSSGKYSAFYRLSFVAQV